MNRSLTASPARALRGVLAAGALMVLAANTAEAQINFAGFTQFRSCGFVACSGSGGWSSSLGVGGNNPFNPSQLDGLQFTQGNFNIMTTGTPSFSTGVIPGLPTNSFGKLFLKDRRYTYDGTIVQMLVTLTNPTAPAQTFQSLLTGTIIACNACVANQDVTVSWQPGVFGVPFTNGPGTGWFDMNIDDITVSIDTPAERTGYISGDVTVVTPEPASLALLGTGLIGVIGFSVRRRRKV